ncbi:MAG: slipin family protein [bacterium]|nr:slipin family protein [bacterium]
MRVRINEFQKGLVFRHGEFIRLLDKGVHRIANFDLSHDVDVVSTRNVYLVHKELEIIAQSELLKDHATVLDIADTQRALIWKNGRFADILVPGVYVLWNKPHKIKVEMADITTIRFEHEKQDSIRRNSGALTQLDQVSVENGHTGLYVVDGEVRAQLKPGVYFFWKDWKRYKVYHFDTREKVMDIAGQDIITSDKVTLRLNAVMGYVVRDVEKAFAVSAELEHALYREGQLALRAVIGTYALDRILQEKEAVVSELEALVKAKAENYGLEVTSIGIRDIILPGEMKELLNKVTEARKEAEANIISRREEVAAMRSQANTAKMLESNATLMKLKELEALERIAANTKLNVVLGGDKGLAGQILSMV